MSVIVLVAMKEEAAALLADPRFGWKPLAEGAYRGEAMGTPLTLVLTGVGKVNAAWGLARAFFASGADPTAPCGGVGAGRRLIVSLGTSGALDATPVGTMTLCDEFVEHDMDVTAFGYPAGVTPNAPSRDPVHRPSEASRVAAVRTCLENAGIPTIPGRELSGDLFLGDAALAGRKLALFGGSSAVLVDMECAAIAKICAGLPETDYMAIRYVSDNADRDAGTSWNAEVGKAAVLFDRALAALAVL